MCKICILLRVRVLGLSSGLMAASSLVTNQSSVAKPKQTKGQFIIAPGVNGTNARIEKKRGGGGVSF